LLNNPAHSGLQSKKLEGEDAIYSARIGRDYRTLGVMKKNRIVCTGSAVTRITIGLSSLSGPEE
jgi:hypothetical protein